VFGYIITVDSDFSCFNFSSSLNLSSSFCFSNSFYFSKSRFSESRCFSNSLCFSISRYLSSSLCFSCSFCLSKFFWSSYSYCLFFSNSCSENPFKPACFSFLFPDSVPRFSYGSVTSFFSVFGFEGGSFRELLKWLSCLAEILVMLDDNQNVSNLSFV
jgi:hypothetical protein